MGVTLVSIEGSGELSDGWGDFDSVEENPFLALEDDVFGPLDEAGQIAFGYNVVA